MAVQQITDESFSRTVLESSKPVVVEFFKHTADGSDNDSTRMSKWVDEWADDDRALFVRMPLDDSPKTAGAYSVQSAPTLLFFSEGEEKQRVIGYDVDDDPGFTTTYAF